MYNIIEISEEQYDKMLGMVGDYVAHPNVRMYVHDYGSEGCVKGIIAAGFDFRVINGKA